MQVQGDHFPLFVGQLRKSIIKPVQLFITHDPSVRPWRFGCDRSCLVQIAGFPNGHCVTKGGANCEIDAFFAEPSYSPDGRAFMTYTPNRIVTLEGTEFLKKYGVGSNPEEKLASLEPYLPVDLGIALVDHQGRVSPWLSPPVGTKGPASG